MKDKHQMENTVNSHIYVKKLSNLGKTKKDFDLVAKEISVSHNGYFYTADHFCLAVVHRSIELIESFVTLMKNKNLITAFSITRIHMDSLLKLYSITKIDYNDFYIFVLEENNLKNYVDKNGNKFTDKFLCESMCSEHKINNLYETYKEISKFIHFSKKHLDMIFKSHGDGRFTVAVPNSDDIYFTERDAETAINNFEKINGRILYILKSWVRQKNNLHIINLSKSKKTLGKMDKNL